MKLLLKLLVSIVNILSASFTNMENVIIYTKKGNSWNVYEKSEDLTQTLTIWNIYLAKKNIN